MDISNLLGFASSNNLKVTIKSKNNSVIEIPAEFVKANVENGIIVSLDVVILTGESVTFNLSATDASGKEISTDGMIIKYFEPNNADYTCYAIGVSGQTECTFYRQSNYFVLTMDGTNTYRFEKVKSNVEDEYYTVNFYLEGQLYSTGKYKFGDQLFVPSTPTKEGNDEYEYSFSGWSPTVVTTVTKNVDYTGYFKETKKAGSNDYNVSPHTTLYPIHLIFIGFAVAELLAVGIAFLVKFITTRKKKTE